WAEGGRVHGARSLSKTQLLRRRRDWAKRQNRMGVISFGDGQCAKKNAEPQGPAFDRLGNGDQAVCLTGMPAASMWACNSPAWNISRTMSAPPTNSPFT